MTPEIPTTVRFSVHAHREVSPGRWYRAFVAAFEGPLSRGNVQMLLDYARKTANREPVVFHGSPAMLERYRALFIAAVDPPTLPFFVVCDILRDELRVVVEDSTLAVPDSVIEGWTRQQSVEHIPSKPAGAISI